MKVLHVNAGLEKGGGLSHIVNLLTEANRQDADFELLMARWQKLPKKQELRQRF